MEHLQMDLIDFTAYKDHNNDFVWLLTIWGAPSILQSDNGKEFTVDIIICVCKTLGITIRHGCSQHPMSQDQIEQLNQTIECELTKMIWNEENQLQDVNWKNNLFKFIFSYNTTKHSVHEIEIDNLQKIQENLSQTVENHLEKVSVIHNKINSQLEKSRKYMLKHSSVHHLMNLYEQG
ncbi:451_t:CDS:2 [Acaulospora morrowiae]|uniref:451_t:CDS:1 n=1 Tax=Acaulospora morrowiae TaxID=94023 RepID=A0A9N8VJK7_9GLOM|nr:451_t:CDS:2 [Acaulospora morrowiae]